MARLISSDGTEIYVETSKEIQSIMNKNPYMSKSASTSTLITFDTDKSNKIEVMTKVDLNKVYDEKREQMERENKCYIDNTNDAIVFLERHFETLLACKNHSSRSQFRSYVIDILKSNYHEVLDYEVVDKWLRSKMIFSSATYFWGSCLIMALFWGVAFMLFKNAYLWSGITFVGIFLLTFIFDTAFFKGKK